MYNKIYKLPLIVVKDGVAAEFQINDSRTEMVNPPYNRSAKRKQDLDDAKLFEENESNNQKMMAMCEDVWAQSNRDNAPPKISVFEFMQKIDQSRDFAQKVEINLSHLREEKRLLQALEPETLSDSEINDVDTKIEHNRTLLNSFWEGVMKENEELKQLMNTDT